MIGMYSGSVAGRTRKRKGFVMLHHEMRDYLKDFSPSEWMVLTALSLFADETGHSCPSVGEISRVTGLSGRTCQEAIKSLSTGNVRGYVVLRAERREDKSGRTTTNGYAILPDGFPVPDEEEGAEIAGGEGAKNVGGEGAKSAPSLTLKNIHIEEYPPIVPQRGTKRSKIAMPKQTDPAHVLFVAYRTALYGESVAEAYTLGEWRSAHHVVRSMQGAGITPDQVFAGTNRLKAQWGNATMVTINALWKHWTASQVQPNEVDAISALIERSDDIFDKVMGAIPA